jgi:hypothetical protein
MLFHKTWERNRNLSSSCHVLSKLEPYLRDKCWLHGGREKKLKRLLITQVDNNLWNDICIEQSVQKQLLVWAFPHYKNLFYYVKSRDNIESACTVVL